MSGSNVVAVKKAVFDTLATAPALSGVDVSYTWRRDFGREAIYGGHARADQTIAAMRGGGRVPRDESITLTVAIRVRNFQSDAVAGDQRVAGLLQVLEEQLAGDPTLSGLPNLLFIGVKGIDLLSPAFDDDAVTCEALAEIGYRSYLT